MIIIITIYIKAYLGRTSWRVGKGWYEANGTLAGVTSEANAVKLIGQMRGWN